MAMSKQWTRRVRTLGRGASGAEVFLVADDVSGELFAVKSACTSGAAALRREQAVMAGLRSPRVVSCIGGRAGRDGSYLHGETIVHGDVKASNVMIGADGRTKLADFGCARKVCVGTSMPIIGGTPAFMAPEVARGEEQGSAADVWALGCTVVEMATSRAPWSGMDGDMLAAMHRILSNGWRARVVRGRRRATEGTRGEEGRRGAHLVAGVGERRATATEWRAWRCGRRRRTAARQRRRRRTAWRCGRRRHCGCGGLRACEVSVAARGRNWPKRPLVPVGSSNRYER
jgi:hypothetical protein